MGRGKVKPHFSSLRRFSVPNKWAWSQALRHVMGKRNLNSFVFRLPTRPENGIRDSVFVFCFLACENSRPSSLTRAGSEEGRLFSQAICFPIQEPITWSLHLRVEKGIPASISFFRFPTTLDDIFQLSCLFLVFRFRTILKIGIWTSIFVFSFLWYCHFPEKCWHFLSLTIDQLETTSLMKSFSYWGNNSYEDLLEVIKNRYPNLRGCTVVC